VDTETQGWANKAQRTANCMGVITAKSQHPDGFNVITIAKEKYFIVTTLSLSPSLALSSIQFLIMRLKHVRSRLLSSFGGFEWLCHNGFIADPTIGVSAFANNSFSLCSVQHEGFTASLVFS